MLHLMQVLTKSVKVIACSYLLLTMLLLLLLLLLILTHRLLIAHASTTNETFLLLLRLGETAESIQSRILILSGRLG